MNIHFQVSKPANLFHVVDSLSDWDSHTRAHIKKLYEKSYEISDEEKALLGHYARIRERTHWSLLDSLFIPSRSITQAYSECKKHLYPFEVDILKRVMDAFSENFDVIYGSTRPMLVERKRDLEETVAVLDFDEIFTTVASFFAARDYPIDVHAHLLLNATGNSGGGGANLEPKNHITLEPHHLGGRSHDFFLRDLDVALHEITHLIERRADPAGVTRYNEVVERKGLTPLEGEILRESIVETFFPTRLLSVRYGFMGQDELSTRLKNAKEGELPSQDGLRMYRFAFRKKLSAYLIDSTSETLDKGTSVFDGDYLEKAADLLISLRPNK